MRNQHSPKTYFLIAPIMAIMLLVVLAASGQAADEKWAANFWNNKDLSGSPVLTRWDKTIDFDWGSNGEPDGFDSWRLYNYSLDNLPSVESTHSVVNDWLDAALADGELIKVGGLYYDPKHRAPQG